MANSVSLVPKDATAYSHAELLARLQGVVEESKTQNFSYLQFQGNKGIYLIPNGTDEPDELPADTKCYLNIFESRKGWVCWKEGKPVDTVEVPLLEPLPEESSLEDHGPYSTDPNKREGWKQQYTAFLRIVEDGKQYQLKLGSPSATRAFGALFMEIIEQATAMHDLKEETPVITLGVESFRSNNYKNYKPRFEIVGWEKNPEATVAPAVTKESSAEAAEEAPALPSGRKRG